MKKSEYEKILSWSKKIRAIKLMGGACEKCGDENIYHLVFHHIGEKESNINDIRNSSWKVIEKEIKKCSLLCHNCHYEFHFGERKDVISKHNKNLFLDIKGVDCCEKCGYNYCVSSLHIHHINPSEKKYKFSNFRVKFKTIGDIKNEIIEELSNCIILCANCHSEEHIDKSFYEKNKEMIYHKSEFMKSKQKKLDRGLIKEMYYSHNMKQIDIANYFQCSKGTISDIIKKLRSGNSVE